MAQHDMWAGLPASWTAQHVDSRFQDYEPLDLHEQLLMGGELERPPILDEDVPLPRWSQELDGASRSPHPAFEVQTLGSM